MNILALDLGTQCGWALHQRGGVITGGSEAFAPGKHGGAGGRWLAFRRLLTETNAHAELHAVYYEKVVRHEGTIAAHVYGGFVAILEMWAATHRVPLYPVAVGLIKKSWTGKGNADKALMIAEAVKRGFTPVDHNHADALAILHCAIKGMAIQTTKGGEE